MKQLIILATLCIIAVGCTSIDTLPLVDKNNFETTLHGEKISLYTLKNSNGVTAQITNYGARIVSLFIPDRDGNFADISLGFNKATDYMNANEPYYGATIGRYGNRIKHGQFTIDDKTYQVQCNNGPNSLHGGENGFCLQVWNVIQVEEDYIELSYLSSDGEQGYPGKLDVRVRYHLTAKDELKIEYFASTNKSTHVNLTHHSFFNLAGEGMGTINDHLLYINADTYTPVDSLLIPTGQFENVMHTPFDFTTPTPIGKHVDDNHIQLKHGLGYDHNFVLNTSQDKKLTHAATIKEPLSGRVMKVLTNEPGLQFYGGNFMDGSDVGKYGIPLKYREAFCLETQHFPDTPNQPQFPSTLLNPDKDYYSVCIYQFTTE